MSDLLQSQINESCKLALPDGLKELMNDISREVLRSNPENLYQFIANYLEALLDAREALSIACRICGEICSCSCIPELDYELRCIGLSEEDVDKAKKIIQEYFDKGQVKESNLLIKLARKTSVTETQLGELKKAVRRAFQRYILKRKDLSKLPNTGGTWENSTEPSQQTSVSENTLSTETSTSDFYKPPRSEDSSSFKDSQKYLAILRSAVRLVRGIRKVKYTPGKCTDKSSELEANPVYMSASYKPCKVSESITTLAGSFVDLPSKVPYSVHESTDTVDLAIKGSSVLNFLKTHLITEHKPKPTDEDELSEKISVIEFNNLHHDNKEAVDNIISTITRFFEDRSKHTDEEKESFDGKVETISESSSASL